MEDKKGLTRKILEGAAITGVGMGLVGLGSAGAMDIFTDMDPNLTDYLITAGILGGLGTLGGAYLRALDKITEDIPGEYLTGTKFGERPYRDL